MRTIKLKRASAVAASAALLGISATIPAHAAATAACEMTVGSITSGGNMGYSHVTASSPIAARQSTGVHLFSPGAAKISSTWTLTLDAPAGDTTYGEVVLNSTLYSASYGHGSDGTPTSSLASQGAGWNGYLAIEDSFYWGGTIRTARYALRGDGVLYRWDNQTRVVSRYPGYSAVKTMALISETKTYDTFLATTRGGALYTIHIPANTALKPIVKQVRAATWQGFESLVAEKCGSQSTLLTAIDKDTGSAYLYAVSHANGSATVIKGLGKVPGTYKDPVYYLHTAEGNAPLFGE